MVSDKSSEVQCILKKIDTAPNPMIAYQYAIQAESVAIQNNNEYQIASTQLVLTNILIQNGIYKEALSKNWDALQYFSKIEDSSKEAKCWKYMALIYRFLGDKQKQQEYNKKCLEITKKLQDPIEEIKILNNIGHTYFELEQYDQAEAIFKRNLESTHLTKDLHAVSLKNLGKLYFKKKEYDKAKTIFKITISIAKKHNLPIYVIASTHFLGHIYLNQNQAAKAVPYLKTAVDEIYKKKVFKTELLMQYEALVEALLAVGKSAEAKHYFQKYKELNKFLNKQAKDQAIKSLQFKFEINEVAKERSLLAAQNKQLQLANNKIQEQRLIVVAQTEELKAVNEALKSFAHRVAHDIKQPIRTIINFVGLLEREVAGDLSKRGKEFMNFITIATKDIVQFIDDILKYTESDQSSQPATLVNCTVVIEQIKNRLLAQLQETSGTILYNELPSIHAHEALLVQVFQNLISNAIKFRRPNVAPIIKIQGTETEEEYIFELADNGIGIKEEHQEKVFQLFSRLHSKSEYEGSGIGLSTVLKILKRYSATITLRSIYGEGTTFRIVFPKKK